MANALDELNANVNEQGRDVNVIEKQLQVETTTGDTIFQVVLWVLGILPGIIFIFMKKSAQSYFDGLQQRIQHNASQIDNFLEQRFEILKNVAGIVEKSTTLDKEVMTAVAAARSGIDATGDKSEALAQADAAINSLRATIEAYPDLKSQRVLFDAMQQNSYLQKEITAAREVYNDNVLQWNRDIFVWPTKKIVAAKNGYTTRVPFTASKAVKEAARGTFF